jgi:hypothetical protein
MLCGGERVNALLAPISVTGIILDGPIVKVVDVGVGLVPEAAISTQSHRHCGLRLLILHTCHIE